MTFLKEICVRCGPRTFCRTAKCQKKVVIDRHRSNRKLCRNILPLHRPEPSWGAGMQMGWDWDKIIIFMGWNRTVVHGMGQRDGTKWDPTGFLHQFFTNFTPKIVVKKFGVKNGCKKGLLEYQFLHHTFFTSYLFCNKIKIQNIYFFKTWDNNGMGQIPLGWDGTVT